MLPVFTHWPCFLQAPEIVVAKQFDCRADLWSIGVILYGKLAMVVLAMSVK